ncbi:MAG TPA: PilN domain-containing protein [Oleiagrimonas sp.]|nr:PilN domain-containing protein [Oleiagrimonas sp.]
MAHINLLPWRAERRKQREREFYGQLVLAGVAGLIVVIGWAFWMGQRIDNQNARNDYLNGQIKQVQVKIDKIKDLEKVRQQLLDRKRIIEKLQSNRSQMVHLFDVLVKTAPDSVRLTSLKQNKQHLELVGVAQSNASVAEYMRNLEASPWLGTPVLKKTVNNHDGSRMPYSFSLGVNLSKPSDAEREAAANAKAAQNDKATANAALPAAAASAADQGGAINVIAPKEPAQGKTNDIGDKTTATGAKPGAVTLPLAGGEKGVKS